MDQYMSQQLDSLTNKMDVFERSAKSDHERIRKLERKVRDLEQIIKDHQNKDGPNRDAGEMKRRQSPSPLSPARRDRRRERSRSRSPVVRRRHASPERRVHVNNFEAADARDVESLLSHDLSHFGQIVDIYVDPNLKWANVTYETARQAQDCLRYHENTRSGLNCRQYHESTKR